MQKELWFTHTCPYFLSCITHREKGGISTSWAGQEREYFVISNECSTQILEVRAETLPQRTLYEEKILMSIILDFLYFRPAFGCLLFESSKPDFGTAKSGAKDDKIVTPSTPRSGGVFCFFCYPRASLKTASKNIGSYSDALRVPQQTHMHFCT